MAKDEKAWGLLLFLLQLIWGMDDGMSRLRCSRGGRGGVSIGYEPIYGFWVKGVVASYFVDSSRSKTSFQHSETNVVHAQCFD